VNYEVISVLSKFEVRREEDVTQLEAQHRAAAQNIKMEYQHAEAGALENDVLSSDTHTVNREPIHTLPKTGRNEPCPCGSNKKYKQCHGRFT
jgi:preprotein translocase subunit SecA